MLSGIASTEIDFSARDICNIIKTCKESGVAEFSLGALQVNFGKTPGAAEPQLPLTDPSLIKPQSEQTTEMQLTVGDEVNLAEAFYAQQLIDDPVGFEETILGGFIEKERVSNENSRYREA